MRRAELLRYNTSSTMRIIDLTQTLFDHMPVYPGDPDLILTQIQTIEKEGWNMGRIEMNLHDGTHVNAPIHMTTRGKTLDELPLEHFTGQCVLYKDGMTFDRNMGVIFTIKNIDMALAKQLAQMPPKFVGLSDRFEFDIEVEKYLLANDIVSYERLANTDKLPEQFMFYGFPLRIKEGDGSPVRAVAVIE